MIGGHRHQGSPRVPVHRLISSVGPTSPWSSSVSFSGNYAMIKQP